MTSAGPARSDAPLRPAAEAREAARDRARLAAWHGGWAVTVALGAALGPWREALDGAAAWAVAAMAAAGVLGLLLARSGDAAARALTLTGWIAATVAAAALTGGLSGPLAGFVLAPVAAGTALGGGRALQAGALGAALAALAGAASTGWLGGGAPDPAPAALTAALTLLFLAFAAPMAWRARDGRLSRAEAAEQRLGALLAEQPGLTLMTEASGRVVAAYGAPPAGLPVDPLFAEGLAEAVHPPDRPALRNALIRAGGGQEAQVVVAPRLAMDRRVRATIKRAVGRSDLRLIVRLEDATAAYVRELELETARAEAEAREAGKTRFLANMSHELRTPLNAVLGFADIMRQRIFGPLPDRYAEYADSIHQAGGHLLDLINDVLDVSKIEAERYLLSPERFDAREVASAAVALVRVAAEDKGVTLTADLPDRPLPVDADRRALKQIALNLLSNAVKFTPSGGAVMIALDAAGGDVELTVADTGVGIAAEDIDRLGRPFEQAGGAEQRALGTGLGLSLVRAFAELHGGTMTIESTLGEGAAVTVRLPVVAEAAEGGGAEIIPLPRRNGG